jgi:Glycosidases
MKSIQEINWDQLLAGPFQPSPTAWEDQVLYFFLVDRFSDGREAEYLNNTGETVSSGDTPPYHADKDQGSAHATDDDAREWRRAGATWCGGDLRGATSKLGYLKRLGATALWVSPVLKQAAHVSDSYHGYGTQNFLDIDPHFGTPDDLRALVATAHGMGMYVILDVILNHAADVFAYAEEAGEDPTWRPEPYPVAGFRDATGKPILPFGPVDLGQFPDAWPEGAIWPRELQTPEAFSRKGRIENWDQKPEYEEGDFFVLKDFDLGSGEGDAFEPSDALRALTDCYKYWIAYADLDGLRLDTVKHMTAGAISWFVGEIHAFAESIGKRNFYLIGEIVGDREYTCRALRVTDLDAALGIGEVPQKIRGIVHGTTAPADYFDMFVNSRREGECHPDPVWWRDRVVTFFDDHDQVGKDIKGRFASEFGFERERQDRGVLRAVAFQAMTLGIPCLYYGTEQGFDGHVPEGGDPLAEYAQGATPEDQLIRECLFGGAFGAFGSRGRHFFREDSWLYQQIARLLTLRRENSALRRGRQYLREVSEDGEQFWAPIPGKEPYHGVVAWSRVLDVDELVCALNTDEDGAARRVFVTTDASRHGKGADAMRYLYSTDPAQVGQEACIVETGGRSAVEIHVPAGGFVLVR